jgi:protein TonB
MPSAPKRNKNEEEAAIRRFAAEIARQMGRGVSERDYPRLARDRRWEGTTHLMLQVHSGGKLDKVTVATSSGYDILDARAIELIKRLKLPTVPDEIQSSTFVVRIPIKFALRE